MELPRRNRAAVGAEKRQNKRRQYASVMDIPRCCVRDSRGKWKVGMKRQRTDRHELIEAFIKKQPLTRNNVIREICLRVVEVAEQGVALTPKFLLVMLHA